MSDVSIRTLILVRGSRVRPKEKRAPLHRARPGPGKAQPQHASDARFANGCACQAGVGPLKNSVIPIIAL